MKEESVNKFEVGENLKMIQKVFRKEGNSEMEVGVERINVQFVGMKPKSETICLVKIIEEQRQRAILREQYLIQQRDTYVDDLMNQNR